MDDTAPGTPPGPPDVPAGLAFPGAVRLELDELLDQVIERASELKTVQGRLRKLLAATHHIAPRLDVGELHQRVVDSARGLVDARAAVLALVRGDHPAAVTSGAADGDVAELGRLATGDGVLRPLLVDEVPLRLATLDGDEAHPYLGVPLRVGGAVYGALHLLDKRGATEFSRDDEELVTTLAGAAGVAIENARLLDGARRRARWESAAAELSRRLLAGSLDPTEGLRHLLDEALVLSDSQGAVLTTVEDRDPSSVTVPCATGLLGSLEGRRYPEDDTITAAALESGRAIVVSSVTADGRGSQLVEAAPSVASALAMRLSDGIAGDGTHSVLLLVRDGGRRSFEEDDVDLVEGLAAQASTTLAVARSRADREALRRVEDRELLVADLNTRVLQRLLKVGTALSSAASAADGATRDRVLAQVDELDDLVRELRRAVWRSPPGAGGTAAVTPSRSEQVPRPRGR
ncbi:GAF domain-containing protein [Actinomycetospora sp. TBRC 11914]|uniref:GAF domain-containing protein n=1 Tax=Actinomycetospora sp. TBRC 11914 TaxID=2729387 RepID=UPI00145DA96C|nr:GAF domain-containing protein [Actinomycetospora sp. TBRC 11914]NMO89455.1 GAF domain-containing protein [Actinomycetospora sp. TBRC 11914]